MSSDQLYHLGFGRSDLPAGTDLVLLSGDPGRSELIATEHLSGAQKRPELALGIGLISA